MARNATLLACLTKLRLEARLSANAALNIQDRDRQVQILQTEQQRLWQRFDWPHLRVQRFMPMQDGQRFYDLTEAKLENGRAPSAQIPVDRVECLEAKIGGVWVALSRGIGAGHYASCDSALGERSSPARCWALAEDEQIEIWPVPDADPDTRMNGYLRVTGIRDLHPFVDDADKADLDDDLIVYYAAAAFADQATEMRVLAKAQQHMATLTGALSGIKSFSLLPGTGAPPRKPPETEVISQYRPAGSV